MIKFIFLKRIFIVILLCFVIVACTYQKNEKSIQGEWKIESFDLFNKDTISLEQILLFEVFKDIDTLYMVINDEEIIIKDNRNQILDNSKYQWCKDKSAFYVDNKTTEDYKCTVIFKKDESLVLKFKEFSYHLSKR
ncbi:MAG: hypothetical protein U9R42_04885 [Bacteroidota bacterium]|nr:hypothetical protein [Bacteroidota bacterium]